MVNSNIPSLPFTLETPLEMVIAADPDWQAGLGWGNPRPGHPEGQVVFHIHDVLDNIDRFFKNSAHRPNLRLIALIHDTFKYKSSQLISRTIRRSHAYYARKFAERYISDSGVLDVVELHDEAYKSSFLWTQHRNCDAAEKRAIELIIRLKNHIDLFMEFYYCDNRTGDKSIIHYEWFEELVNLNLTFR